MPDTLAHALIPGNLPTFSFVLTRVTGLALAAPLWSMSGLPKMFRAGLAAILTAILLPLTPQVEMPESVMLLPAGMAVELLIGLTIGLTAAVLVHAVAMAGEVVATQMGLNLTPSLTPMSESLVPGVGQLQSLLALMIYLGVGGHLVLIRVLAESFTAIPPGAAVAVDGGAVVGMTLIATFYEAALMTAAPALVALILIDVAVAITSRAVPQVHAILVLFPATIGIGLLIVGLSLPLVASTLHGWMTDLPNRAASAVEAFRP
jgi:flagellar biosynthetic protein FliR